MSGRAPEGMKSSSSRKPALLAGGNPRIAKGDGTAALNALADHYASKRI